VLSIERNEGRKPVTTSQATMQQKGTVSRDGWSWTADPEVVSDTATGAREKCLASPAEDWPQGRSTCKGKSGNGDKATTPTSRVGAPKTEISRVEPAKPPPDPPPVDGDWEVVVQWTHGTMRRVGPDRATRIYANSMPPHKIWKRITLDHIPSRAELQRRFPRICDDQEFEVRKVAKGKGGPEIVLGHEMWEAWRNKVPTMAARESYLFTLQEPSNSTRSWHVVMSPAWSGEAGEHERLPAIFKNQPTTSLDNR
jgi:hypothetical protein